MDETNTCACGAEKSVYSYACDGCKDAEAAQFATDVQWIRAEKQARWGDRTALNDLIDNE